MSDADDKLDFCKQALGEIGTRSTITAVDPPDGSPEAFYCNLFFNGTRDQVLRAAHWNFAGRSTVGQLWKSLPGTRYNPTIPPNYSWSNRDPAPPWLYAYQYPSLYISQIRRVRAQQWPETTGFSEVPFYGGYVPGTNSNQLSLAPFEVASDNFDGAGAALSRTGRLSEIVIATPGTGYRPGDFIMLTGGGSVWNNPATVGVSTISADGSDGASFVYIAGFGGSFTVAPSGPLVQAMTTGSGTGFSCTATFVDNPNSVKVILTNAENAIIDYTAPDALIADYDPGFADAFMLAFEGKLALALQGDKAMAQAKFQQANAALIDARVRDGNEGLTTYDHVPDWLAVRGVASMGSPSGWFNPPYGPLFAV